MSHTKNSLDNPGHGNIKQESDKSNESGEALRVSVPPWFIVFQNVKSSFIIASGFEDALRAAGLDSFDRIMALEAPREAVTRAVPGRFTVRIELPPAASGRAPLAVYLKRYRGRGRASAAAHEWRRLGEVAAAGIPCPVPVAFGERRGLLAGESFLMTLEIPHAEQADWWIRGRPARRREVIEAVAELARRFHDAGFHHRDLYLCHFFVQDGAPGPDPAGRPLALYLIDLQRCGRLGGRSRRWLVKDLAQLHRSLGEAGFTSDDWEVLAGRYGLSDPRLLAAVERKSARIARHVPRHG
jgi:lipopolysaccharide kinase (Kdo/WaaP) family protein